MNSFYLGQDLGMGANKLFGAHGGSVLQSIVAADTGREITQSLGFQRNKKPQHIRFDGVSFYVGEDSHDWGTPIESMDYERMVENHETQAILYGNLTNYLKSHQPETLDQLYLVVGLPLAVMSGEAAHKTTDKIRKWLKGPHNWESDGQPFQVIIQETKVASQPSGALFDYLLDDQGLFYPERKQHYKAEMGIISIGFNTIELLTVKDRKIVQNSTQGKNIGVRRLLELHTDHQFYTLGEMDTKLRSGNINISPILPVWQSQVVGTIEETWGQKWRRFSKIILVGGGVKLIGEHLMDYFQGKAIIPDDPVISISRGLYKSALMINQKKASS